MKAIIHRDHGGPDVLQLVDRDLPVPGPGEVRVRIAVSGINPTDLQARSGPAHTKQFSEVTPHLDGAVVLAAGGAGAVGHAVIQLARWAGATVISTVSGPDKARLAAAAGAHHVVDYREGDPAAEIRGIAPDGVDLVAEVALGVNLALDLAVLRARGTIATYANEGGRPVELDVTRHLVLNTRLQFLVLYTAGPQVRTAAAEDVAAALRDGALPVGEEHGLPLTRLPLHRTADAHRAVESGTVGKVVVDM
ncbi:zinc-binding dehydrogenase [Streptomyces tendae]